jgi:hypothetical protein
MIVALAGRVGIDFGFFVARAFRQWQGSWGRQS